MKKIHLYLLISIPFAILFGVFLTQVPKVLALGCADGTSGSNTATWTCTAGSLCLGTWQIVDSGSISTGETVGTMNITDINDSKKALMCSLFKNIFTRDIAWPYISWRTGANAGWQFYGNFDGTVVLEGLTADGRWHFASAHDGETVMLDNGTWSFTAPLAYSNEASITLPSCAAKYKCSGTSCVQDSAGTYTTLNCDNQCSSTTCALSISPSSARYCDGQWTWSGTSNPTGLKVKWYGTKNGVQDENGSDYGQVTNFTSPDGPWPSSAIGNYTRYFKGINAAGNEVCTSNTVSSSIVDCAGSAYTISGYVKNQNNQPIIGATVSATNAQADGGCPFSPSPWVYATSDSNGYYSLAINQTWSVPCNYVKISVSKTGCEFSSPAVPVFPLQTVTKDIAGSCGVSACTVSISASPNPISSGQATTITWSSTNVSGLCTASGGSSGWLVGNGAKDPSGSWPSSALTQSSTYTLTCKNSSSTPCSKSVTVNIGASPLLTVTKAGIGSGTVTSAPTGINCGSDCTENYASGTSVTLTAAPASGSTFAGWSGECSGSGFTLTVTKAGTGSGTVTSAPTGINCGSDCVENYAPGASVTLTASPATGSTFTGWSGNCSGSNTTCTVTMSAAKTVTATFISVGTYSGQVAIAVKLNSPSSANPDYYGYYGGPGGGSGLTIIAGSTNWFLVDPKGFTGKSRPTTKIAFIDYAQGGNLTAWIYTIDQNDNLHPDYPDFNPYPVPLSGNTFAPWSPRFGHNDSQRYLIKIVENAGQSIPYTLFWFF